MKKEHDKYLCKNFPKLFKDRHASMQQTAMCWGFECGDGWYPIIKGLCYAIQGHIDYRAKQIREAKAWNKMVKADPNWRPTWWGTKAEAPELKEVLAPVPQVTVGQVKEKFGTLRFYYDGGDDVIRNFVSMAEIMSGFMCDQCSAATETDRSGGWMHTTCEPCQEKREQERAAEAAAYEAKAKV